MCGGGQLSVQGCQPIAVFGPIDFAAREAFGEQFLRGTVCLSRAIGPARAPDRSPALATVVLPYLASMTPIIPLSLWSRM